MEYEETDFTFHTKPKSKKSKKERIKSGTSRKTVIRETTREIVITESNRQTTGIDEFDVDEFDYTSALTVPEERRHFGNKAVPSTNLSVYASSVDEEDFNCGRCEQSKRSHIAKGYCTNCGQFLCHKCLILHIETELYQRHILLQLQRVTRDEVRGRPAIEARSQSTLAIAPLNTLVVAPVSMYLEEYVFVKDVNVKSSEDDKNCIVSNIAVLTNGKLAIIDHANKALKVVNTETNVVEDAVKFDSNPRGVTGLPDSQLALTIPSEGKVKILGTNPKFVEIRNLRLGERCNNVKYINGKLLVSFLNPLKFLVTTLHGDVLKTINPKGNISELCPEPFDMAISHDEKIIVLSCDETRTLLTMHVDGVKIAVNSTHTDKPRGLEFLPDGSIYVCNCEEHKLQKLSTDLKEARPLLDEGDGLAFPATICFNNDQRLLFVSSLCSSPKYCNFIKKFKLWK